jgi:hypothetical protein
MKARLLYMDEDQHDVLCRILTGAIHVDTLTPSELVALSTMRVQCGLEPIEGIEEIPQ